MFETIVRILRSLMDILLSDVGRTSFRYDSIDSKARHIRLLKILPRKPKSKHSTPNLEGTIHCTIETVTLDEKLVYDALSYRWGPTDPKATISVSGCPFDVTPNLFYALRQLRDDNYAAPIWIDAICINQQDTTEKNQQLPLMKPIYAGAASVIVWLGPAADGSAEFMDALTTVGEKSLKAGMLDIDPAMRAVLFDPNPDERRAKIEAAVYKLSEEIGFEFPFIERKQFSERDYWRRVWIVQEMVLPKNLTITCGQKRISYLFFAAGNLFMDLHVILLNKRISQIPQEALFNLQTATPTPLALNVMSFLQTDADPAPSYLVGARQKHHRERGTRDSLFDLIGRGCVVGSAYSQRQATDPKDMIYGFLGLAHDAADIKPLIDYSAATTPAQLYIAVTRILLAQGNSDVLAWNQPGKCLNPLPSWVPDFSSIIREPCFTAHIRPCFHASDVSKKLNPDPMDRLHPNHLHLRGIRIDTIRSLGSHWIAPLPSVFDAAAITAYFTSIESLCLASQSLANPMPPDAASRIACGDQAYDPRGGRVKITAEEAREGWEDVLTWMTEGKLQSEVGARFEMAMAALHARRVMMGESGRVGLGPAAARERDVVVVFSGCDVPYVVRKTEDGLWELVGEGFLYGIMDGEALKLGLKEEVFVLG